MDLDGKVALITGAASGIGRATAERLHAEGMRICAVDLDEAGGTAVADAVDGVFVTADAGEPTQVDDAFATCVRELGGVDLAFLNAGIAIGHADLATLPDELYRRIMRVNVDGVFYGARAAIRAMTGGTPPGGAIVATASLAGIVPFPPDPVYDATKHAVVGLIRSIAPTLEPLGITASCINPGMTDTNILGPETKERFAEVGFPLMPASQIADAVVTAVTSGETGLCWVCQPGRPPTPYGFHGVPGPASTGDEGKVPPSVAPGNR